MKPEPQKMDVTNTVQLKILSEQVERGVFPLPGLSNAAAEIRWMRNFI
jgi:hypothetical protein